jgi:hypothetical protein
MELFFFIIPNRNNIKRIVITMKLTINYKV